MNIDTWFNNGCDYVSGVTLYGNIKGHSHNLHRLFLRKESPANVKKLAYELGKRRNFTTQIKDAPAPETSPPQITPVVSKSKNSFYRINELHPDLHALAIKQRTDFQTAISLHCQLTALHADEEGKALALCIKIEDLFDAIETAQKVLSHYVKHKVLIDISPRTYKDYTGGQLADARRNKRTSVTKIQKRVTAIEKQLEQNVSKTERNKLTTALERASKKQLEHEMDLMQLTELINKNDR